MKKEKVKYYNVNIKCTNCHFSGTEEIECGTRTYVIDLRECPRCGCNSLKVVHNSLTSHSRKLLEI